MNVKTSISLLTVVWLGITACSDDDAGDGTTTATASPGSTAPGSTAPGSAAPDEAALFEESFDDDTNGWGILDDPEYGTTAYADGDYVWSFTGSNGHLIPEVLGTQYDNGELDMVDVVVRASATIVSGDGVIGVFCREVPDTDAEFQWYEFVARDGFAAIRRADLEGNLEMLAETDDVELPLGEAIGFEAACTDDADGNAALSMNINGSEVLTATDDEALGNGVPGIQAWTFPVHEQMDVRWHEFSISGPAT